MKSEDNLAQNWFIFNIFNSLGFTEFVLVLFPLCLFLRSIFLAKNGTNQIKWGHSIITFALRGREVHQNAKVCKQRDREGVHFIANVPI